jgi:hypothetical protein
MGFTRPPTAASHRRLSTVVDVRRTSRLPPFAQQSPRPPLCFLSRFLNAQFNKKSNARALLANQDTYEKIKLQLEAEEKADKKLKKAGDLFRLFRYFVMSLFLRNVFGFAAPTLSRFVNARLRVGIDPFRWLQDIDMCICVHRLGPSSTNLKSTTSTSLRR